MIRSISVSGVRNLKIEKTDFSSGINIVVGENGQGKTNLLESIYILSQGKPFFSDKSKVVGFKNESGSIGSRIDDLEIQIILSKSKETRIFINGKQKNVSSLLGKFLCVSFHPRDIDIITGTPSTRRVWLDRLLSLVDRSYLLSLIKYNKAIQNRNKLLAQNLPPGQIDSWNELVSKLGIFLWLKRVQIIRRANIILKKESSRITKKPAVLDYESPQIIFDKNAQQKYISKLEDVYEYDRRVKATTFGPHRDDFKIIFEEKKDSSILYKDINFFGSRAEQRQAALLLKLIELRILKDEFGVYPTLLLDDVVSELDEENRKFLTDPLAKQIILTTTSLKMLPPSLVNKSKVFSMRDGMLYSGATSGVEVS